MEVKEIVKIENTLKNKIRIISVSDRPIFPGMITPLMIHNKENIKTISESLEDDSFIGIVLKKEKKVEEDDDDDSNAPNDIYDVGTIGKILKRINLPDGGINIYVSMIKRFVIKRKIEEDGKLYAIVDYPEETIEDDLESKALTRSILTQMKRLTENNPLFSEEVKLNMVNLNEPSKISDFVSSVINISGEEQQQLLSEFNVNKRLKMALTHINKEVEVFKLQKKIQKQINSKIEKTQRNFFLREQLKAIKEELGISEDSKSKEYDEFKKKLDKIDFSDANVKEEVYKELEKFSYIERSSPEYQISRTYLDTITSLDWNKKKYKTIDLKKAEAILEKDHYGLKDIKGRILEFISVLNKKQETAGSIICLVGPPGVGKTSIGKSIAHALSRKFFRFSVGGMRDEAEIKGHRRTYVGAMPGKIIQGIKTYKSNNVVFMIDEIDKMEDSYRGSPASTLLEVLDPEQNSFFRDNYLDIPYDISNILFIVTANTLDTIPEPLLDRMEIIRLPGYITEEKIEIAKKYIIKKSMEKHGLKKGEIKYEDEVLKEIALSYARESGMRRYEQFIDKINRKVVKQLSLNEITSPVEIKMQNLASYLGNKIFTEDHINISRPGMVIGLAYTSMGGDTLTLEAISIKGKGGFKMTGKLGDVMKESVEIAYSYVRSVASDYGVDNNFFEDNFIHIHFPEGATPKDGPSAGVTIATCLLSLATGKKVENDIAMTGELSLTGSVLKIGGLKEKTVAAKRANIKHVLMPIENDKDLEEINSNVKEGIEFHPVKYVREVFEFVFK